MVAQTQHALEQDPAALADLPALTPAIARAARHAELEAADALRAAVALVRQSDILPASPPCNGAASKLQQVGYSQKAPADGMVPE